MPISEVRGLRKDECRATTDMLELAKLAQADDAAALRAALLPLTEAYAAWILQQCAIAAGAGKRRETQKALMDQAELARQRMHATLYDNLDLDLCRKAMTAMAGRSCNCVMFTR